MSPAHASSQSLSVEDAQRQTVLSNGQSLWDWSQNRKVLLIFVRHSRCTFCRESLMELAKHRHILESQQITPVVVHLSEQADGQKLLEVAGLPHVLHIPDPQGLLYKAFDLERGSLFQLLGPRVWWLGFRSAILKGLGPSRITRHVSQLGGAFLTSSGFILQTFRARDAADSVPYGSLLDSKNK